MPDPQDHRAGGVAVWRIPSPFAGTVDGFLASEQAVIALAGVPEPGTWFPLAEAEALIDPNDPAVIERAERAVAYCIARNFPSDRTAWTILAALRSKGGTDV